MYNAECATWEYKLFDLEIIFKYRNKTTNRLGSIWSTAPKLYCLTLLETFLCQSVQHECVDVFKYWGSRCCCLIFSYIVFSNHIQYDLWIESAPVTTPGMLTGAPLSRPPVHRDDAGLAARRAAARAARARAPARPAGRRPGGTSDTRQPARTPRHDEPRPVPQTAASTEGS